MTKNVAASVQARLKNQAKSSNRPFQEVLQFFGLERFLYRLSRSKHRDSFVLKGALMLRVWGVPESRPTRDIDLLGYVDNGIDTLEAIVKEVCLVEVDDDGMVFDQSTITGVAIKEDADYQGVRIKFTGFLENARIPMQIDVGFGDVVHPSPEEKDFPVLLDFPAPRIRTYPLETVVAEKFQAMVYLGSLNSRMKDFFDIWLLACQFDFRGADLAKAIADTFENRDTELESEPVALTTAFTSAERTQKQWTAFVKRSKLNDAPATLEEIRSSLREFLVPVATALAEGRDFNGIWAAPGPWGDAQGG